MASHAVVATPEHRLIAARLAQSVKDDALPWILGGHFDERLARHPGHHYMVVEEDRAGVARMDEMHLKAGLRENQHLRFDGNAERVERRSQIASRVVELELNLAILDFAVELLDWIGDRRGVVLYRGMIGRGEKRARQLSKKSA